MHDIFEKVNLLKAHSTQISSHFEPRYSICVQNDRKCIRYITSIGELPSIGELASLHMTRAYHQREVDTPITTPIKGNDVHDSIESSYNVKQKLV